MNLSIHPHQSITYEIVLRKTTNINGENKVISLASANSSGHDTSDCVPPTPHDDSAKFVSPLKLGENSSFRGKLLNIADRRKELPCNNARKKNNCPFKERLHFSLS